MHPSQGSCNIPWCMISLWHSHSTAVSAFHFISFSFPFSCISLFFCAFPFSCFSFRLFFHDHVHLFAEHSSMMTSMVMTTNTWIAYVIASDGIRWTWTWTWQAWIGMGYRLAWRTIRIAILRYLWWGFIHLISSHLTVVTHYTFPNFFLFSLMIISCYDAIFVFMILVLFVCYAMLYMKYMK